MLQLFFYHINGLEYIFSLYYCSSYGKIKAALIVKMLIVPTCVLIGLDLLTELDIIYDAKMIRPVSAVILILYRNIMLLPAKKKLVRA